MKKQTNKQKKQVHNYILIWSDFLARSKIALKQKFNSVFVYFYLVDPATFLACNSLWLTLK